MVYLRTWDASYEADPADSDDAAQGANRVRDLRTDIRERLEKDHYMDITGTDADHGEHKKITLHEPILTPANVANKGFIYGKDVGGKIELHYLDEDDDEVLLTEGGSIPVASLSGPHDIPSTETIAFYKDTVVTGYTLENTLDDKLLFVTKGSVAGGESGGGVHSTGTWTVSGLTKDAHTHGAGTLVGPSHTHPIGTMVDGRDGGIVVVSDVDITDADGDDPVTGDTGGQSDSGITSAGTWRPDAYCFTMQTRN